LVTLKRIKITANVFVITFLILILIGTIFVNLISANPAPLFAFPNEPITTLPTIVLNSPIQNQNYNMTNLWLNFTIIKPKSWFAIDVGSHADFSPLSETFVNITSISYTIDQGERQKILVKDIDSLFDADPIFKLNFSTLLAIEDGTHSVKVGLEADSYYVINYVYNFSEALSSEKLYAESDVTTFTVVTESLEQQDITLVETESSFPTTIVLVASVTTFALMGSGLLVYFKKRKQ